MYDHAKLTAFYNQDALRRDHSDLSDWKREERERFLAELRAEGKTTLLELGAGPGRDSLFFKENGLDVLAADLSPEMVKLCQAKGLVAEVADMMALPFEAERFDAVYALNSLLHVPKDRFEATLRGVRRVLKPGGLFYLGLYGGQDSERRSDFDPEGLERFFASYSDRVLLEQVQNVFTLIYFRWVQVARDGSHHFQSLIVKKA